MATKNIHECIGKEYDFLKDDSVTLKAEIAAKENTHPEVIKTPGEGCWAQYGTDFMPIPASVEKLDPGSYTIFTTMQGWGLTKQNFKTDTLLDFEDDPTQVIMDHVKEYWSLKETFQKLGFLHKRGILMWGPQGSGKTSVAVKIAKTLIEKGDIVIDGSSCSPYTLGPVLLAIRKIEPDRDLAVIFEDIDDIIAAYGSKKLTSILDGENNIDNVLFLATTNYPEYLPPKIIERPSRFDVVEFIGMPNASTRRAYLAQKTNMDGETLELWVNKTSGFSIPQIKELIILVHGYVMSLDSAVEKLQAAGNTLKGTRSIFRNPPKQD